MPELESLFYEYISHFSDIQHEGYMYKKSKNLLEMENEVEAFQRRVDSIKKSNKDITEKEIMKKMSKHTTKFLTSMIKKLTNEFGLKINLSLAIVHTPIENLWVRHYYPNLYRVEFHKFDQYITCKHGKVQFTSNAHERIRSIEIFITSGILYNINNSAETIIGLLMHEIGHIFFYWFALYGFFLDKLGCDTPEKRELRNVEQRWDELSRFKKRIILGKAIKEYNDIVSSSWTEHSERFADHFSTYLGYADVLVSKLLQINRSHFKSGSNSILGKIKHDIEVMAFDFLTASSYPNDRNRALLNTRILNRELKRRNITPKQKALLKKKLDAIKKELKDNFGDDAGDTLYTKFRNDRLKKHIKDGDASSLYEYDREIIDAFDDYTDN